MPGKPDSHQDNLALTRGTYFPGSKEYRAWDEGWRRRYASTGDNKAGTTHTAGTAEFEADQAGWDAANANTAGKCRMPVSCGAPPTASP